MSGKADEVLVMAPVPHRPDHPVDHLLKVNRLWEATDAEAFMAEVAPRIRGIAAAGRTRIDAAMMDRFPALEIVSNFGVGYDRVDVPEAVKRGIMVTNTPDVLNEEVADMTIGLLLATIRQIPQADRFARSGAWSQGLFPFTASLRGRTVGIAGLGRIGKAIARRLEGFGVGIEYYGRSRQADVDYPYHDSIEALATAVDTLILVVPGGADTRHLVNDGVLKALGSNGVLVNIARGSVVDQPALIRALQDGTIHAAGLDVFEAEPTIPPELVALDNVVLTPHAGSASVHTRQEIGHLLISNLESWLAGKGALTPIPETAHLAR